MWLNIFSKFTGGNKGNASAKAEAFVQALTRDLGLTADQASGIKDALSNFMQERRKAKQAGDKDGIREEKEEFRTRIMGILNDEQEKTFLQKFNDYKQLLKG
jgi:hypothetical protein